MAHPSKKSPAWTRPRLAKPDIDGGLSPAQHAEQAAEAEANYDFEAARQHLLAAAHQAGGAEAVAAVARYAAFLVERYGQFGEVAQWLDDPQFDAPAEAKGPGAQLLALLARAAAEAQHPRSVDLDRRAAAAGDAPAALRTAQRLVAQGAEAEAIALLEPQEGRWRADEPARLLLADLRQQAAGRVAGAFAGLHRALNAGDAELAERELQVLAGAWSAHPAYAAALARAKQLRDQQQAASARAQAQQALERGDWSAAVALVKALVAMPGASDADRTWRRFVEDAAQGAVAQQLVQQAELQPTDQAWTTLAGVVAQFGPRGDLAVASPQHPLHRAYAALVEAQALAKGTPLTSRLPALPALAALVEQADADPDDLRIWIERLPADWLGVSAVQAARHRVADHDALMRATEENAFAEAIQAMLDYEELEDAAAALAEWSRRAGPASPAIQQLRRDLLQARQAHEQRTRMTQEFQSAVARGAWFHARSLLGELTHLLPQAQVVALRAELDSVSGPALRGSPMPPGLQKLAQAPLAAAVVGDRLLVVQDGLWLAVVLPSMGLQPFALPKGWEIRAESMVKMALVDGQVRLVGLSGDRLVVVGQLAGEAPVVEAAIELRQALRGDDLLLGSSLDPASPSLCVLSRHSQRGAATTWTRLDSQTLEVRSHKRFTPALAGSQPVQHWPGRHLVVAHARERQGGQQWALALLDDDGAVQNRWRDADIGEWVAGLRQVVAWPETERIYASFTTHDAFDPGTVRGDPSLLVLRGDKVVFASTDLRRRFFPLEPLAIDHAWTLDPAAGRLWFAALPTEGPAPRDALLLGVDAKTLRPDRPAQLEGMARVLSLMAVADGAVALCQTHAGSYSLVRAVVTSGQLQLTAHKLPL